MASNPFDQFDNQGDDSSVKANPFDMFDEKDLTAGRVGELITRGMMPVTTGAAAGAVAGAPVGMSAPLALVGSLAVPIGDALNTVVNELSKGNTAVENYIRGLVGVEQTAQPVQLPMVSGMVSRGMENIGLGAQPTSTTERVIESAAGGLGGAGTQLAGLSRLAQEGASTVTREVAKQLGTAPVTQLAVSAPAAATAQYVTEETESPLAGQAAAFGVGALAGVRPRRTEGFPSSEQLSMESSALFQKAKEANVVFKPEKFTKKMQDIGSELRAEGYSPKGYPKVAAALEEMQNTTTPKDFTELQTLRKMIQNAQASIEPSEKRLGSILKEKFDDYVSTAPKDDVALGTKEGVDAWKQARETYTRLMKSEVFGDMLENAQLDRSKFTQSGAENSMAQQLRSLAKNDKKMRMFTAEEQKAIKQAAKGDTTQNLLKFYGRFAPTSPVGGLFAGGATVAEPTIGVPFGLGAMGSRAAATRLRQQSIEDLIAQMRLGRPAEITPRTALSPLTGMRGLLSTQDATRQFIEQENPLGF
jgi:hypothetical protein